MRNMQNALNMTMWRPLWGPRMKLSLLLVYVEMAVMLPPGDIIYVMNGLV